MLITCLKNNGTWVQKGESLEEGTNGIVEEKRRRCWEVNMIKVYYIYIS
jgi:hypothetical protein